MDIVGIIPARGGSLGIPKKNIRLLNGQPLLYYTIEAALKSGVAKDVFVSTDSREIAKVAANCGANLIDRPKELASDTASTESVLIHALGVIKEERKWEPEFVLTLPPTSPLRGPDTIKKFITNYLSISGKFDAMVSFTETRGDYWIKNNKGEFRRLFPGAPRRRQDREPLYLENSAIYITKTKSLLDTNSILGNNCAGFVIDDIEAIDINKPIDLKWAEFILKSMPSKR